MIPIMMLTGTCCARRHRFVGASSTYSLRQGNDMVEVVRNITLSHDIRLLTSIDPQKLGYNKIFLICVASKRWTGALKDDGTV